MSRSTAPVFDHRDTGTPEADWLGAPQWSGVPVESATGLLGGAGHLLVVAAHPDDETLGCAGLLAAAADAGRRVTVVVASLGEASHPESPTHRPQRLAALREHEVRAAVQLLAPGSRLVLLRLPDGRLRATPGRLAAALAELVDPDTLVLAPWRHDGHADHETAGLVAAEVAAAAGARLLEYPVWLWHWGEPEALPWPQAVRVELDREQQRRRRAAMAVHVTQTAPLSDRPGDEVLLGPHLLAHFERDFETYLRAAAGDDVFDGMFADTDDPWDVEHSWYERRKRAVTLAAPQQERLGRVLEVGCSTGVLTAELAARADHVLALDLSREALSRARRRVADDGAPVELRHARVPQDWPDGRFDLVVLSEVGYFWSPQELAEVVRRLPGSLAPGGTVLLCHWRHPVRGWPLDGADVHRAVLAVPGLDLLVRHVEEDFEVLLLGPRGATSPARAEGKE